MGFNSGSDCRESACSAGDLDLVPGWEDALEKGMATHSSILAWEIAWTEKPGGLWSMGSQRVGHDWSDLACAHTQTALMKTDPMLFSPRER